MQLAQESERGPGQFLVLGPFQLWRKPAAHLELEEVFRLFLARRPDEAQGTLRAVRQEVPRQGPRPLQARGAGRGVDRGADGRLRPGAFDPGEPGQRAGFRDRRRPGPGAGAHLRADRRRTSSWKRPSTSTSIWTAASSGSRSSGTSPRSTRRLGDRGGSGPLRGALPHVSSACGCTGLPSPTRRASRRAATCRFRSSAGSGSPTRTAWPSRRRGSAPSSSISRRRRERAPKSSWREGAKSLDLKYRADLAVLAGSLEEGVGLYLQSLEADPERRRGSWNGC